MRQRKYSVKKERKLVRNLTVTGRRCKETTALTSKASESHSKSKRKDKKDGAFLKLS